MSIVEFYWPTALAGGALIGFSAVVLMAAIGKIAGISGILGSLLSRGGALPWQWAFIAGLLISGFLIHWLYAPIPLVVEANRLLLVVAGLLVGFGTRLGNGCTSGHGVCGLSRFSGRSLVATLVFMSVAVLTVFVMSVMGKGA